MTTKLVWTDAERQAWRLPAKMTVSQWADKHRILDPRSSAEPGPWHTSRTPYLRGPMDAFADPQVEELTIMKPPQSGGTEALYNMMGYCIGEDPGPAMLVMPRDDDCDYTSENRLKPMVRASAELLKHTTGRIWDLSKRDFHFDTMTLYFAGSNSPAGLGSKPIRYLFLDEIDKYPPFAGKEANPVDLAIKRTLTFWDRKIVKASTPTTTTGGITISFDLSNRQEYHIPCPRCGEFSVWTFPQLKIPKNLRDPDKIRQSIGVVWYQCEHCTHRIDESDKEKLIATGTWLADGQKLDADGNISGKPIREKRHSGFHYSALVSPWVSWPEIMAQWFEANTEQGIAIGKLIDFNNSILSQAFRETGKKLKAKEVRKLTGGFSQRTVPPDCQILVASADYHKTRVRGLVTIPYEVRAFSFGMKNYVIDTGIATSFEQLEQAIFFTKFTWADDTNKDAQPLLAPTVLFIDSSFKPDDVYDYCRQHPGLTIPTKGMPGPRMKPLQPSDLESATEYRLNRRQRARYRGMQLLVVDTYYFKDQVTSWVEPLLDEDDKIIAEPLTLFYDEIPSYYFTEFTNEQKVAVRDKHGNVKYIWVPVGKGVPTHSLDTAVLCAAAGYYKGVQYLRREESKKPAPKQLTRTKIRKRKRRRRAGWLDNLPEL